MKFTVTLTLDVDEQSYADLNFDGTVPADVLRGDVALWIADTVNDDLWHVKVVAVTDQPLDQNGNPVAREDQHVHEWRLHRNVTSKGHVLPAYEACWCGAAREGSE